MPGLAPFGVLPSGPTDLKTAMRISAKAEYACLALIELARSGANGTPRRVRDIAEAQGIPDRYLVQVLLQLKAAGLVQSVRGSEGGYHLLCRADQISVADIVRAIDGPGDFTRRSSSPAAKELAELLTRAGTAERDVLASATIAQFIRPELTREWVI
jgi:Rrf2 family transcriptional regulator, cysteine metabolism repressor